MRALTLLDLVASVARVRCQARDPSVSDAGRLIPSVISVVGSDTVRKGEICTGCRLVGLSRVPAWPPG